MAVPISGAGGGFTSYGAGQGGGAGSTGGMTDARFQQIMELLMQLLKQMQGKEGKGDEGGGSGGSEGAGGSQGSGGSGGAEDLQDLFADPEKLRKMLQEAGFQDTEIDAFMKKAGIDTQGAGMPGGGATPVESEDITG